MSAAGCVAKGRITDYVPKDPALKKEPLFYYPARTATPKAFVFFLGNDVAFWAPHQRLAWDLSGEGYTVVGIDIRKYLGKLPSAEPAHDSAFGADIGPLIDRVRHEMNADSLPVILGGHSFGAELSFWIARYHPPAHLIGVLAISTRSTGHLFVTPEDWLNHEASGPLSFSTIQIAHDLDPTIRIALVRGAHDPFIGHDSAFAVAGGARLKRYVIPMAGHSLENLIVAGPMISGAVKFLLDPTTTH